MLRFQTDLLLEKLLPKCGGRDFRPRTGRKEEEETRIDIVVGFSKDFSDFSAPALGFHYHLPFTSIGHKH
jgi:hypothetical protein